MYRRTVVLTLFVGATILIPSITRAQSGEIAPKFEVASIRRCVSRVPGIVLAGPPSPGRITVRCISAMGLIRQSYILFANGTMNLMPVNVVVSENGLRWINSDLYTIEAKAEGKPGEMPPGQGMMLGPMMQALLEERFSLKVHREIRQVPVYELILGKRYPSLHHATEGGCVVQNLDQPLPPPTGGRAPGVFCGMALFTNNGFDLRGAHPGAALHSSVRAGEQEGHQ